MPMWPTRADGTRSSMPWSRPSPARRIETTQSFLPASIGAAISASGVSIGGRRGRQIARHLVREQQRDLARQLTELDHRGVPLAHQGELVLDQRVIDHDDVVGLGVHVASSLIVALA